jgi:peptidoglycan hydrolase-like protein with peptidoglycan-binding domain
MKSHQSKNITPTSSNKLSFKKENNKHFFSKPNTFLPSQKGNGYNDVIQRQETTEDVILTDEQVNKAIRFNRFEYPPAQLRILQRSLQITETGRSDRETALAVAQYQQTHDLTVDGMAGPNTFAAIHADADITDKDDLIIFSVNVDSGVAMTTGGGTTDMLGHLK